MATVSFHLKDPKADRPTAIFAFLAHEGGRIKVYTGLSVHPAKWVKDSQRAQVRGRGNELNGHLNDSLDAAETDLLECYGHYRAAGMLPNAAQLKEAIIPKASEPAIAKPQSQTTLLEIYEAWIEVV